MVETYSTIQFRVCLSDQLSNYSRPILHYLSDLNWHGPMSGETVAEIDRASGDWLAVVIENGDSVEYLLENDFSAIWESDQDFLER